MAGELASGHCRPVRHTRPALPTHLPECELSEDSEDNDDEEYHGGVMTHQNLVI